MAARPDAGGAGLVLPPFLVALGLAAGPMAGVGFGRFAYGLVLPSMRADLHWSFATAGALNTANALGYLGGALVAAPVASRIGQRWVFVGGLLLTAVAVTASAATGSVAVLLALRTVAGAAGAGCFIMGASLAAGVTFGRSHRRSAFLLATYFAGGACGIVVSGLAVPPVLTAAGWRGAWLVLGLLSLLALLAAVPATLALHRSASFAPDRPRRVRWPARKLAPLLLSYGVYGAGYIAYLTFIVAFLRELGAGGGEVTVFWTVLGLAAIGATVAWGPLLGSLPASRGTALVLGTLTLGSLLPLLWTAPLAAFASAVLFGGSFLAVVTAVTATARRSLPPEHWTAAIAGLTIAFALGQCVGPLLSGVLSDDAGGVRAGLAIGALFLAIAVLAALAQPGVTFEAGGIGHDRTG